MGAQLQVKRGTPSHPKTLDLAAYLDLELWGAVGLLESLFLWAATYTRRGDVGRMSNRQIAKGLGWSGDPERLIEALVMSHWLDKCQCHRLRLHDWHEHADQGVRHSDVIKKQGFLECYTIPAAASSLNGDSSANEGGMKGASPTTGTGQEENGTGKTATEDGPRKNPLVDRDALIREGYALIREIAALENLDPTEVVMKGSDFKGRGKVRLDTMTDDRLARSVGDLRTWARRLKGIVEPIRPPTKIPLAEDPAVQAFMRGALEMDLEAGNDESGVRGRLANPKGSGTPDVGRDGP